MNAIQRVAQSADTAVMTCLHKVTYPSDDSRTTDPAERYGLTAGAFDRAWAIADIQKYLGIGRTQVYALMRSEGAPPRLRTGSSHRWNGAQVMAWLHGDMHSDGGADAPVPLVENGSVAKSRAHLATKAPTRTTSAGRAPLHAVPADEPEQGEPGLAGAIAGDKSTEVRIVAPADVHRQRTVERAARLVRRA